jgi:hypothetical protein
MSSARKRASLAKANTAIFALRQRLMLAEHQASILEQLVKEFTRRYDDLQARLDALMLEYCPDEMTEEQLANWGRHQTHTSEEEQPLSGCERAGAALVVGMEEPSGLAGSKP